MLHEYEQYRQHRNGAAIPLGYDIHALLDIEANAINGNYLMHYKVNIPRFICRFVQIRINEACVAFKPLLRRKYIKKLVLRHLASRELLTVQMLLDGPIHYMIEGHRSVELRQVVAEFVAGVYAEIWHHWDALPPMPNIINVDEEAYNQFDQIDVDGWDFYVNIFAFIRHEIVEYNGRNPGKQVKEFALLPLPNMKPFFMSFTGPSLKNFFSPAANA